MVPQIDRPSCLLSPERLQIRLDGACVSRMRVGGRLAHRGDACSSLGRSGHPLPERVGLRIRSGAGGGVLPVQVRTQRGVDLPGWGGCLGPETLGDAACSAGEVAGADGGGHGRGHQFGVAGCASSFPRAVTADHRARAAIGSAPARANRHRVEAGRAISGIKGGDARQPFVYWSA